MNPNLVEDSQTSLAMDECGCGHECGFQSGGGITAQYNYGDGEDGNGSGDGLGTGETCNTDGDGFGDSFDGDGDGDSIGPTYQPTIRDDGRPRHPTAGELADDNEVTGVIEDFTRAGVLVPIGAGMVQPAPGRSWAPVMHALAILNLERPV